MWACEIDFELSNEKKRDRLTLILFCVILLTMGIRCELELEIPVVYKTYSFACDFRLFSNFSSLVPLLNMTHPLLSFNQSPTQTNSPDQLVSMWSGNAQHALHFRTPCSLFFVRSPLEM